MLSVKCMSYNSDLLSKNFKNKVQMMIYDLRIMRKKPEL